MRRFPLAVLALALAAGPAKAQSHCQLALRAVVPLIEYANGYRLAVDAKLNGKPARLLVDTGAENILLSQKMAEKANNERGIGTLIPGTEELGEGSTRGVGGIRNATFLRIDDFALGRLHGSFVAESTFDPATFEAEHIDGLIGMSFLGSLDFDLDLPDHQLRLFSAGKCEHPLTMLTGAVYAVPLQSGYHSQVRLVLPVTIDGQSFIAQLDTGAAGTFLFRSAAARLGLSADTSAHSFTATGVGGREKAGVTRLQTLVVGPLTMRNVEVAIGSDDFPGADLLLGIDFVRKVHVWVSNSSHTLILEYPPLPSPPLASAN